MRHWPKSIHFEISRFVSMKRPFFLFLLIFLSGSISTDSGLLGTGSAQNNPIAPIADDSCNKWDDQFGLGNGTNGFVTSIAVQNDIVYVGGRFTIAGSVTANNIAKYNLSTKTWSPLASSTGNGVNSQVLTILAVGQDLYVGGIFTSANVGDAPVPVNYLAKYNTTSSVWSAVGNGGGNGVRTEDSGAVSSLAYKNGYLFVGGVFTQVNAGGPIVTARNIVRFHLETKQWTPLLFGNTNGTGKPVTKIAIGGDILYAGGENFIYRFNLIENAGLLIGVAQLPGFSAYVRDFVIVQNELFVVGNFSSVVHPVASSAIVRNIAKYDFLSDTWSPLDLPGSGLDWIGVAPRVTSIAAIDDDLYIGGEFSKVYYGNDLILTPNRLVKYSRSFHTWTSLESEAGDGIEGGNSFPYTLTSVNNRLYIGGSFDLIKKAGVPISVNNIAIYEVQGMRFGSLTVPSANGILTSARPTYIRAILRNGDDLYVGGSFRAVGNVSANNIAKYNLRTKSWAALGTSESNGVGASGLDEVNAIVLLGEDLLVGGQFTDANSGRSPINVSNLARFNLRTQTWSTIDSSEQSGPNGGVYEFEVSGENVYIGGTFSFINTRGGPISARNIVEYNAATKSWNALGTAGGNGVNGIVGAIKKIGDDVYVGGTFNRANIGGTTLTANSIARWNPINGWQLLTGPGNGNGVLGSVKTIVTDGNFILIGGTFVTANVGSQSITANNLARWNSSSGWSPFTGPGNGNGVNNSVYVITNLGDSFLIGGGFTMTNVGSNPIAANYIARWSQNNGWESLTDTNGNNGVGRTQFTSDPYVFAIQASTNDIFLGGVFNLAGGKISYNIARFYCQATGPILNTEMMASASCISPGNSVGVTTRITNPNNYASPTQFTAELPASVSAITNSCGSNLGTCSITNRSKIDWRGVLNAGESVTVNYRMQVNDQALDLSPICILSTSTVGNSPETRMTSCLSINCPPVGPGSLAQTTSPAGGQKPGSVLFYNLITSSTDTNRQNTRINLTNIHPAISSYVHLFFIDGSNCSVADSYLCLTPNQTTSFLAADLDPGTTGYLVAVATDAKGCPINFNYLIGDEYIKLSTGHAANLSAMASTAISGGLLVCDGTTTNTTLNFDGISYSRLPLTLASDNIPSRADGNDTLLIVNRLGGNLATGAATIGSIFGLMFDDQENTASFSLPASACQLRGSLSPNFPRTTPRFESLIPAGRSGWMKFWPADGISALSGSVINFNSNSSGNAGAFNQGRNLHVLRTSPNAAYSMPVFPPSC